MTSRDPEMGRNSKRRSLFERLSEGLKEGVAYAKGLISLRTVEVSEEPPENDGSTTVSKEPKPRRDKA